MIRVGTGYDVHRLVEGRPLVLGGVEIPFDKGSLGHSDGDAVCHAIADALLGGAGLGDIGQHFPDQDPKYAGFYSVHFLELVREKLVAAGFRILNLDTTIILQQPKLAAHVPEMRKKIAAALQLPTGAVNLKATTTEGLGITGRGEAVAAQAACSLEILSHGG